MDDPAIRPATKSKLVSFQDDCYDHTKKMLNDERDKLTDYLDEQTNVITKENRTTQLRHSHKPSMNLNQSTRIDLSTDDSKSFEGTSHTEQYKKITSFYIEEGRKQKEKEKESSKRLGQRDRARIRHLRKKVSKQSQVIKMLVTWVKIYAEREQSFMSLDVSLPNDNKLQ